MFNNDKSAKRIESGKIFKETTNLKVKFVIAKSFGFRTKQSDNHSEEISNVDAKFWLMKTLQKY